MTNPSQDLSLTLKIEHEKDGSFEYSLNFRTLFNLRFNGHTEDGNRETTVYCRPFGEHLSCYNRLIILKIGSNDINEIRALFQKLGKHTQTIKEYYFAGGEIDGVSIEDKLVDFLQSIENNPRAIAVST